MSKIYKPRAISGFPEWLPEVRAVEQQWFDHIRKTFESYGFCSIETPSVEELEVLGAKGEVDKEIYVIERLHKDVNDKEVRLGLHFDQTVPLARYVAQHFNELTFPFKRYQMQRVWRGERPQAGRFREFYQCDIDVINVDGLPLHFDAEMPAIIWEILSQLPGLENEKIQLQINNRKILLGLLDDVTKAENQAEILRVLDKRLKLEPDDFEKQLNEILGRHITSNIALQNVKDDLQTLFKYRDTLVQLDINQQIEKLEAILIGHMSYEGYQSLKAQNELPSFKTPNSIFYIGVKELISVLKSLSHLPKHAVVADFFMVRGLDYYTGTVYETVFLDDPSYGSICSGGRYDDLASKYITKHLPGVGISIGFSRLFDRVRLKGNLPIKSKSPTQVLVTVFDDAQRLEALKTAAQFRSRGLNAEVYHAPQKFQKQLGYADKKQIPFVWFLPAEGKGHQVKDMTTGEQIDADPATWSPK